MGQTTVIRIGTRASALAQWQARWVAGALGAHGHAFELVPITTRGDTVQQSPIAAIGTRGVFTNELQRALLDDRIDVAVHSLKDLPTEATAGIALAAVPPRESPYDVLVSREGFALSALPKSARIGTGSPRRQTQLWHLRPDFQMNPIRGNVDTRIRKLFEGECDALILAEAGLRRLGLIEHVTEILPPSTMMPAVGQGALGLETRADDLSTRTALAPLDDSATRAAVTAERSLLAAIGGGCLAPVGAWARVDGGRLVLDGVVLSPDGQQRLAAKDFGAFGEAHELGARLASQLLAQGARELIQAARKA
jgi:hydroxymethylbilane synthase